MGIYGMRLVWGWGFVGVSKILGAGYNWGVREVPLRI